MDIDWITIGLSVYATITVVILLSVIAGLQEKAVRIIPLILAAVFWPIWLVIWLISAFKKR